MISLPRTLKELEQNPSMAVCLHYTHEGRKKGLTIEIRTVQSGELVATPILLRDKSIQESSKLIDPIDETIAAILKKVRITYNPFSGIN